MGSCDLVGLGWLSSGLQESSQPCTLQQEGEGSGVLPEHRMMQKNQALRVGCWSVFCCAVQLLLVSSKITLLLRSTSSVSSRERISDKDIDIVSLKSPAVA